MVGPALTGVVSAGDSGRGNMGDKLRRGDRARTGCTGDAGNGEVRPRWPRGTGSEMIGTDNATPWGDGGRASDSDADRAGCMGADTGVSGSARVGGFARLAERGDRANGLRARTSSADTLRESSGDAAEYALGGSGGTSGSGPCGGGVGGGML